MGGGDAATYETSTEISKLVIRYIDHFTIVIAEIKKKLTKV